MKTTYRAGAQADRMGEHLRFARDGVGRSDRSRLDPDDVDLIARACAAIKSNAVTPAGLTTRAAAADALAMSLNHFERHVQPHLRLVRSGRLCLVPVSQIGRWIEASAERA